MAKDYYKILGVEKNASQEELKKAYRKMAHQHHPDKQGGDEAKFKEINEAYQVLGDEKKRAQYDQYGAGFENMNGFGGGAGFNWQDFARQQGGPQGVHFDMGDLGDIFGDFFGGARRGRTVQRGADIEMDLPLTFREAAFGVGKNVEIYKAHTCDLCKGSGAEPDTEIKTCETCQGSGSVTTTRRTIIGNVQTATVCTSCSGEGKIPTKKCTRCGGDGRVKEKQTLKVEVPGGIEDGMTIKLNGQGEAGPKGGPAGDLYLHVRLEKHDEFRRDGADIISVAKIPFSLAALGGKYDVETVDGPVTLKIPVGTPSGQQFVLRGKGAMRFQRSGRGDHMVTVRVDVPTKISREQKKLLDKLKDLGL